MRSSPRLSLFAACCTAAMLACTAKAEDHLYNFAVTGSSTASGASEVAGWSFNSIGVSGGYANFNAGGDSITLTDTFAQPITNIQVYYKASSADATRILHIDGYNETTGDGPDTRVFQVSTSARTRQDFAFDPSDDVDYVAILLGGSGSKGTWIIYSITIQTADPPMTMDAIPDQTVGSANDLLVHFTVTFPATADFPTISVTAENLTNPGTTISSDTWLIDFNYSMMRPGCYDFTFHPPEGIAPCQIRFTITATGNGSSASRSFVCTVVEGSVPTPPQIYSPWLNPPFVLAGRPISGQVGCDEADNDIVTFELISKTSQGEFVIDQYTGAITFTPTLQDANQGYHVFTVRATDKDGSNDADIRIVVLPVSLPALAPIDNQTVLCGETLQVDLVAEATEYNSSNSEYIDDPLISSNITIKAGTTAPEGECIFEDGCLSFTPTTNDIGQTFIFTASATDLDGTTNQDFNVTVGLAAPVLKHCPVDQWTTTSFTADIQAAVPGATSYTLRYIHYEDNGTVVTGYVNDATFPCVVENLSATNYVYDVQAKRGAITSAWSNTKSIDLHAYIAPTYAVPMKGAAHGTYHQNFDGLISSGSAYWYDARTIAGWYAASSSGSMSDVKYAANSGGSSGTGLFSCQVDDENVENRALAARADTQYDEFSFGVMFTNMCEYAVTNLHVSFTAMQFRRYNPISHLYFSYTRSNRLIDYNDPANIWTPVGALDFAAPTQGSSARLYPPTEASKSADLPFEGVNAIQPGEVIALRWYLDAKSNYPTLGIDDLTVSWECAWPRQTVIILQ